MSTANVESKMNSAEEAAKDVAANAKTKQASVKADLTKLAHAAGEAAQKAVHGAEELAKKAQHTGHEIATAVADKLKGG
jgi:hypothetical protein